MYQHLPPFWPQGDRGDGPACSLSHGSGYSCFPWDMPRSPLLTENAPGGGSGPHSSTSQDPCLIFPVHAPEVLPLTCLAPSYSWDFVHDTSYTQNCSSRTPLPGKLYSKATLIDALPSTSLGRIRHLLCSHSTYYSSVCLFSQPDHFSMLFSKPHIPTKNIVDTCQGLNPFLFCFVLKQLLGIQKSDPHLLAGLWCLLTNLPASSPFLPPTCVTSVYKNQQWLHIIYRLKSELCNLMFRASLRLSILPPTISHGAS